MPTPYNMAFACLGCRKSFKREFDLADGCPGQLVCPECGGAAYNFGLHFKAPRKNDLKQWEKVAYLFEHGFRFQKIRPTRDSLESVPYPDTLAAAKEFVETYKAYALKPISDE